MDSLILAEDDSLQITFECFQRVPIVTGDTLRWNAGDLRYDIFDFMLTNNFALL